MIYEFFGLPGSGKTYCAALFAKNRKLPLIEVHGRVQTYFWTCVFACVSPACFFFFLKEIARENSGNAYLLRHKVHNLFLRAVAKEGKALVRKNAVIDEGLFQAILYIFEKEMTQQDIARHKKFLKKRHLYVVEASRAVREKRMRTRKRFPRAFLNEDYRRRWFPVLEKNYSLICELIKINFPHTKIHNEH